MTREDAKRIAQGLITHFKCESETMVEFCNVVIEVLNQEPCEDAVSRKAVLDMAKSYCTDGYDSYTPLVVDVEDIEDLPSVTPTRKWIPVSERLPEKEGFYLVSVKNYHESGYSKTCSTWFIRNQNCFALQDVEAWMPSPEPYKAESEGK